MTEGERIAAQFRTSEERREKMRREEEPKHHSAPWIIVGYFGGIAVIAIAIVAALVAAVIFGVRSLSSGSNEPSIYEKFQPVWDSLPPSQQDAICTGWAVSPNSTKAQLADALGYPGQGEALAEMLLNNVC